MGTISLSYQHAIFLCLLVPFFIMKYSIPVWCMSNPHVRYQDLVLKSQNQEQLNSAMSSSTPVVKTNITLRPYRHLRVLGRHVCTLSKVVTKPIKQTESFCKPVYKTYAQPCENDHQKFCNSYKITYEIAYRTVYKVGTQTENHYSCCPGWSQTDPTSPGCLTAICTIACQNGGSCSKPDQCECPPGWSGPACEEDVNECHMSDLEDCEHECINTQGSYRCQCHEGFILQPDGKSCKLNLNRIPEYREFLDGYEILIKKVARLEKMERSYNDMDRKLEDLSTRLDTLNSSIASKESSDSAKDPSDSSNGHGFYGSPLDMIHSLSEQISMLEERLGSCMCDSNRERSRFS